MASRRSPEASAVRILIADSRTDVRSALRLLLEQHDGIVVLGEAVSGNDVVRQARLTHPDVVILDCDLPGVQAARLVLTLRSIRADIRVVAISARSEARPAALAAGADTFISKADIQELVDAISLGFGLCAPKSPAESRMPGALSNPSGGCGESCGVADEGGQ